MVQVYFLVLTFVIVSNIKLQHNPKVLLGINPKNCKRYFNDIYKLNYVLSVTPENCFIEFFFSKLELIVTYFVFDVVLQIC